MFIPKAIYYEENIVNYTLGKELLEKFKDIPKFVIESHNNIEEMRKSKNKDFPRLKQNLIIGVRKTRKICSKLQGVKLFSTIYFVWLHSNVYVLLFSLSLQQMCIFEAFCK